MPPMRILIIGDDKIFNSFLQGYMKEINHKNFNFNKVDLRVFLIPFKINTLAHYLAMHDDLYC